MQAKPAGVLVLVIVAACVFGDRPPPKAAPGAPPILSSPLIAKTQLAPSGSALRVFVDRDRIVGWVAGSGAATGTLVEVASDGAVATATIDADNSFALPYRVTKPTEATITVGTHVQRVTLEPRAA